MGIFPGEATAQNKVRKYPRVGQSISALKTEEVKAGRQGRAMSMPITASTWQGLKGSGGTPKAVGTFSLLFKTQNKLIIALLPYH